MNIGRRRKKEKIELRVEKDFRRFRNFFIIFFCFCRVPEKSQFLLKKFGPKVSAELLASVPLILVHWSVLCRSQSSWAGPQIVQLQKMKFSLNTTKSCRASKFKVSFIDFLITVQMDNLGQLKHKYNPMNNECN